MKILIFLIILFVDCNRESPQKVPCEFYLALIFDSQNKLDDPSLTVEQKKINQESVEINKDGYFLCKIAERGEK